MIYPDTLTKCMTKYDTVEDYEKDVELDKLRMREYNEYHKDAHLLDVLERIASALEYRNTM